MAAVASCGACKAPLEPGDEFCPSCGRVTGRVEWHLSSGGSPDDGSVRIRPGGAFRLVARNTGTAPVRVSIDAQRARGVRLQGASAGTVEPGREVAFELKHAEPAALGGILAAVSQDGERPDWWERRSLRTEQVRLAECVRVRDEEWFVGTEAVVFPPGVRRQYVRVWNDSDQDRPFETDTPAGYRVLCYGNDVSQRSPSIGAGNSQEMVVEPRNIGPHGAVDEDWVVGPDARPLPMVRLSGERREEGAAVVVAMDFGTRNCRARVRWRRLVVAGKPPDTVDEVVNVPAAMVLDTRERSFDWGVDAARRIDQNLLQPGEVAAVNLKTCLREGRDAFVQHRPEWTNAELLRRYLQRVFARLDDYFRTVDPTGPLSREGLATRYVLTRPVMDFNEGDARGGEYERALLGALADCGVPEQQVVFVLEPVAAAIGIAASRQQELLGLPEGAAVAVVDAGGGTTDVSLARVHLANGKPSLEVAASYDLRVGADNPARPALARCGVADDQFGGNVLDCALAEQLLTAAAAVLETNARPVPAQLTVDSPQSLVNDCRQMKEEFAWSSEQYLYRDPPGKPPSPRGTACPFPNRPEYEGVYLQHGLYDQHVQAPVMQPIVSELGERMAASAADLGGLRPAQVARVFYVGGTNLDPFVRGHFGRVFPLARPEVEDEARSDERIPERLNAVIEGAVWFDERMFAPSPLTLALRLPEEEVAIVRQGEILKPSGLSFPLVRTRALGAWETLDAALVASEGGLAGATVVARAFQRNDADVPMDVALRVSVSRDRGVVATLVAGDRTYDQWRFALVEAS